MPRRPRHEARDRCHERRRDIRRRKKHELEKRRREESENWRRHRILRWLEDVAWWFIHVTLPRDTFIKRVIRRGHRTIEALRLAHDIIRRQARIVFVIERIRHYFEETERLRIHDDILLSLDPETRDDIIYALRKFSEGKYVDERMIETLPILRWFLQRFLARYGVYPCSHASYAVKITPVTFHYHQGYAVTYYVLRWARAEDVKADPYLGRTRPVDFYFTSMRHKWDLDILNTWVYAGEGTVSGEDRIVLYRDSLGRPRYQFVIRRVLYQPHHIRRAMARATGKPELAYTAHHCSLYAVFTRKPKTPKLYKAGWWRFRFGKRRRTRARTRSYYAGIRA